MTMIPLTNNPVTFMRAAAEQGDQYAAALVMMLGRSDMASNAAERRGDKIGFDYWVSRSDALMGLMQSHMLYLRSQVR